MVSRKDFSSYEDIFGEVDFREGEEARSVLSPAAYLVDLLQLYEDEFREDQPNGLFVGRRENTKDILLNEENTFTELPYLDIANEMMEGKVKQVLASNDNPYLKLLAEKYPLNMPFNLQNEKVKLYLKNLHITPESLYKLFSVTEKSNVSEELSNGILAREYLGLSKEDYSLFTCNVDNVRTLYGITAQDINEAIGLGYITPTTPAGQEPWLILKKVKKFINKTGISYLELTELLNQNLSKKEVGLAEEFYINKAIGRAKLDSTEENITGIEDANADEWLIRANLFIRLAKKTGIAFTDLDLILRSCCDNVLNEEAIKRIAAIQKLSETLELPIDEVCSFFNDINTVGTGNDEAPADLFNRIYNGKITSLDKKYIKVTAIIHEEYNTTEYTELTPAITGNILHEDNKDFTKRISRALGITKDDLKLVVEVLNEKVSSNKFELSTLTAKLSALSLLFRIVKLSAAAGITVKELLNIFDVLNDDPLIRNCSNFDVLISKIPTEKNCYKIISGKNIGDSIWLVQLVVSIAKWMQENDFTAEELKGITTRQKIISEDDKETEESIAMEKEKADRIEFFNNLYKQFKPIVFHEDIFISDTFDKRASRAVYRHMTEQQNKIVSKNDSRLLLCNGDVNENELKSAAYEAIGQLGKIQVSDFLNLDLDIEEKFINKIFSNLFYRGYINAYGDIIEENFPEKAEDFYISTDFSDYKEIVFEIIAQLYTEAQNAEDLDEDIQIRLYPYDFREKLDLPGKELEELFDNLIFNNFIDQDGNMFDPGFFSDTANIEDFQINADIFEYSNKTYSAIADNMKKFEEQDIKLDIGIFTDIGLNESEIDKLVKNLNYNEYIDDDNTFTDKASLLTEKIEGFKLSIAFYPYRHQILEAIKKYISEYRSYFYNVNETVLKDVAGFIIASDIYKTIESDYLENGFITDESKVFFSDQSNIAEFNLGDYFNNNEESLVFNYIAKIYEVVSKYELKASTLSDMGLETGKLEVLVLLLEVDGYLNNGRVSEDKIDYFLDVNNALDFTVEGFDDYNKEIFFALHAIAKETVNGISSLTEALIEAARLQEAELFTALEDFYGIPAETIKVIFRSMYHEQENIMEQFMVPVLKAVDKNDAIAAEPDNNRFNYIFRRTKQFALLVLKLGLTTEETEVAFSEQALVQKFPESLSLPAGITGFNVILEGINDKIYLFGTNNYFVYSAQDYQYIRDFQKTISVIQKADKEDELFKGLTCIDYFYYEYTKKGTDLFSVDAAFIDKNATIHILSGTNYYCKEKDNELWENKERRWGVVDNNFKQIESVDASFVDDEGKTYLFSKDQYIRYSSGDYTTVDEGYPKNITANWQSEFKKGDLNEEFHKSIDASYQGIDKKIYLFKDDKYICSDDFSQSLNINDKFGRIKNNFENIDKVDAALALKDRCFIFSEGQVICYKDNLENNNLYAEEGFPKAIDTFIPNLPYKFKNGIDAAIEDSGKIYMFKDGDCLEIAIQADNSFSYVEGSKTKTEQIWGKIKNNIVDNGTVDSAFVGLDGKAYLFSGNQYYCYSDVDYSKVDAGYPKLISTYWSPLSKVDAALILEDKTYICGTDASGKSMYICYSTNDYKKPDEGYPKDIDDNWWNLPFALTEAHKPVFDKIDAIFTDKDGRTHLFSGNQYIYFDNKHRWWSEPKPICDTWDGVQQVDAAFTGKDGKTYIFFGQNYIRYSSSNYAKIDDRYPNTIRDYWGNVNNGIENTANVDAALSINFIEKDTNNQDVQKTYIYVFSGRQFFRYTKATAETLINPNQIRYTDEGYPKDIATELKQEPCFKNLDISFENGIDAAFANKRNIYIFKDLTCNIIVESLSEALDKEYSIEADCAFIDEGSIYKRTGQNWDKCSDIEGILMTQTPIAQLQLPLLLRDIPIAATGSLKAVFRGTDGASYAFIGNKCYNYLMKKEYDISEEWGRVDNNIVKNKAVDAVFVGLDNKTYMFSGNQYVVYDHEGSGQPLTETYQYIKDVPKTIAEDFAGLRNVYVAFAKGDTTYLLEKPDDTGSFRYVQYSSKDYSKPDQDFPKTADMGWWNIPEQYVEEGFDNVDAVLVEEDNMYLFNEDRYLQHNFKEDIWAYPKPISRLWKDIPIRKIKTIFKGVDNTTYFFQEGGYSRLLENGTFEIFKPDPKAYEDKYIGDIDKYWGKVNNKIVINNRVDAAFVHNEKITYLFSSDQYVRYSTNDYRYIDKGYPKKIYENLRLEEGFSHIDQAIGKTDASYDNEAIIKAIISNKGSIYIFTDNKCIALAQAAVRQISVSTLGEIKNNFSRYNKVDAAFGDNSKTFLLCGDQYIRYSDKTYEYVDEGYPKSINMLCHEGLGITILTENFKYDIDAALLTNSTLYLFKGKKYYCNDIESNISGTWGKMKNEFDPDNHQQDMISVDAAFLSADGNLYVFKNSQYIRYSSLENKYVDEGYPKNIKNNWGNLPANFESSIDAAFVFDNKTYMLKGDEYIRYSGIGYNKIDSIYPQKLANRWGEFSDYLLTDIKLITQFKTLQRQYSGEQCTLADFLEKKYYVAEPYTVLANIFSWDEEEVKWLKRKNSFLSENGIYEVDFNLEAIIKMYDILTVTGKIGASPQDLYEKVWTKMYRVPSAASVADYAAALEEAAKNLYTYIGSINSEKDWKLISEQMHDEENILKRDALVRYLVHKLGGSGVSNTRDLYENLLIDIQMGSCGRTSRIKESLECIQLYFHRYFIGLESPQTDDLDANVVKDRLKGYWKWMKNYRVWEANRKVFLYPENYIRPELRDTKTEQFKALEDETMKGELTTELVEKAYKNYLDSYGEVSKLTVSGGYLYDNESGSDRKIIIFGRTKTDPRKYFYRTATFINGSTESVEWNSWIDTKLQIDSEKVYPVFAFGKTFVFWAKLEINEKEQNQDSKIAKAETDGNGGFKFSNAKESEKVLTIQYSYQDLNKSWISPQTLDKGVLIKEGNSPTGVELCIRSDNKLNKSDHENILINCNYGICNANLINYNIYKTYEAFPATKTENKAYRLTPELYTIEDQNEPYVENSSSEIFKQLFAESIKEEDTVALNLHEAPWFAFDHKGGSFLCKPEGNTIDKNEWPKDLGFDSSLLETSQVYRDFRDHIINNNIDEAFRVCKKNYLIAADRLFKFSGSIINGTDCMNNPDYAASNTQKWGKINVEQAFTVGFSTYSDTYVISGNDYMLYSKGNYNNFREEGYPKNTSLLMNTLKISEHGWTANPELYTMVSTYFNRITAVFCHKGVLYPAIVNSGNKAQIIELSNPNPKLSDVIAEKFGNAEVIRAAFSLNNKIWLMVQNNGRNYFSIYDTTLGVWVCENKYIWNGLQEMFIDAALVHDNKIYLIKENAYMTLDSMPSSDINWVPEKENVNLGFGNSQPVDFAFTIENKMYFVYGTEYISCNSIDQAASQTKKNVSYLAHEVPPKMDSAFYYKGILYAGYHNLYYPVTKNEETPSAFINTVLGQDIIKSAFFFDNRLWIIRYNGNNGYIDIFENIQDYNSFSKSTIYVKENDMNKTIDTAFIDNSRIYLIAGNKYISLHKSQIQGVLVSGIIDWSNSYDNLFNNNFTVRSNIDSTFVYNSGNTEYLYILSGNQYIRYTIAGDAAEIPEYVDGGYPKLLEQNKYPFDAYIKLKEKTYFFKGDCYIQDPTEENIYSEGCNWNEFETKKIIRGYFGNLPQYFSSDIDAAVNDGTNIYIFKDNKFIKYPLNSNALLYHIFDTKYDIIRLSASTSNKLNKRLFAGGIDAFLSIDTQDIDELPKFSKTSSDPSTIKYYEEKINEQTLPKTEHLDYRSANGMFYWEMFFHVPFLIAQSLNTAQKFEEAKTWYEYIFDPTQQQFWNFKPFVDNITDDLIYGTKLSDVQIRKYLEDPFDPHAVAGLRIVAYEKAVVMNYIDNIIDWGDMLLGQYTGESINEARLLYILAYDLLGEKPESMGKRLLVDEQTYRILTSASSMAQNNPDYEFLLELEDSIDSDVNQALCKYMFSGGAVVPKVNGSAISTYFFIPENWFFINYWNTVEDRLYKIRHCMNIMGIKQTLPLFEPPIEPMALVQAVGGGISISQALEGLDVSVPHYRFRFMADKAKELVSKLNQFGNDLLSTLEKSDAEELNILQNTQENVILSMTRGIKQAQLDEAKQNTLSLEESLKNAENTIQHYSKLIAQGLTPAEIAQIALMIGGAAFMGAAAVAKLLCVPLSALPKIILGVFTYGKVDTPEPLEKFAEFSEMTGETLSMAGEIIGIFAAHERMKQDWNLQLAIANSEKIQLTAQIKGARLREDISKYEIEILEEQIRQNESIKTYMKDKFTNKQLYNWMASKLSSLFFQTYKLAYDMAKYAQKSFQFERCIKSSEVNYISPMYWDSLKKGLLSGESLGFDLDRMEKAYIETNCRGLEIAKPISLLELDPLALISLKKKGVCEFSFSEALFDYDFQGHYCRQIKTISVTFKMPGDNTMVNATLTELTHKTVMEPDTKAVKYLMDPKDMQPLTIRSDWRPNQQIVLSPRGEYDENNGLFELKYDDERYLPFEGTGAVSRWRLKLDGKRGSYDPDDIKDVVINLKYTALQGGEAFGNAVKGMLKPYTTAKYISFGEYFSDDWEGFLNNEGSKLELTFTRDMFPNIAGSKIDGIFAVSSLYEEGSVAVVLNSGRDYNLTEGKYVETSGLSISSNGSKLTFTIKGEKENIKDVGLVCFFKAYV